MKYGTRIATLTTATLTIITLAATTTLLGCSSTPNKPANALDNLPHWVVNPQLEGGLADAACVPYSGSLNIDRSEAIHYATEQLAAQLERKVSFLAKGFQSKTQTTQGINTGSDFNQSGQQLVQQSLQGVFTKEVGVYELDGKKQLCVLVAMPAEKSEQLYSQLKNTSGAQLNAKDDAVLYQQFRAYKANQELQQQLSQ